MRIGYDEECEAVIIVGRDVFPACALRATMDTSGKIRVMSLAETAELCTDWFHVETLTAAPSVRRRTPRPMSTVY
jgi:hypothetical protein